MLAPEFLRLLCCPETHQDVQLADPALLESLNRRITSGSLQNRGGRKITEPLEAGLIRDDGKLLFPIRHDIPVMLLDEAIALDCSS